MVRIIPHVRGVDLAVTCDHAAQTLNLFTRRAGARGVHQAGRETTGAFGQALRKLLLHPVEIGLRKRSELISHAGDSQAAMADQRKGARSRRPRGCVEVRTRRGPAPFVVSAKNSVGEIVQELGIGGQRIGRKSAVADDLRGYALRDLFLAALEYLEVGMAMRIDERGRDRQTAAVDHLGVDRRREPADRRDRFIADQYVSGPGLGTRTVDQDATFEENRTHVRSAYFKASARIS